MTQMWFMYDPEDGLEFFETEGAAIHAANRAINGYLDEEWGEGVECVCVGRVTHQSVQCNVVEKKDMDPEDYRRNLVCDYFCDYEMRPVAADSSPPAVAIVGPDGKGVANGANACV